MAPQHCVLVLLLWAAVASGASLSCQDDNGKAVDWFIGIKVPDYIRNNPQNGKQYFLMTSNSPQWKLSPFTVNGEQGALVDTMNLVYDRLNNGDDSSSVAILYNDEWPSDDVLRWRGLDYTTYGHMKGALAFDVNSSGFWIIHSVPKFPEFKEYDYPNTGLKFGQHFLCVTFGYSQLATIAHQLSIARPNTFNFKLPERLAAQNPDLYSVVHRKPPQSSKDSMENQLTSVGGVSFTYFSKSSDFGADLYGDLVAPYLTTPIFMEGWVQGYGDLNSTCSARYPVYRVEGVRLAENNWPGTNDHCKWVVSSNQQSPWVCLGDINRQKSQFHRGGGTLCMSNRMVWSAFKQMVAAYQHCDGR